MAVLAVLSENRKCVCAVLCGLANGRTVMWLQKVAVSNMQLRISGRSALIVGICCNYCRPVRSHTRIKPAKRVFHAQSSINLDPFVPAELPREAPGELAVDKFLKTFSGNLRSLLNCKPQMHLTTRQTQLLTQQTTRVVSLGKLGVTFHVWACKLPNCSLRTEICATFMTILRTMYAT